MCVCVFAMAIITFVDAMVILCVVTSLVCDVNSFGASEVVADCVNGIRLIVVVVEVDDGFVWTTIDDLVDVCDSYESSMLMKVFNGVDGWFCC